MTETLYRALIADDDSSVRQLTILELSPEGFVCDPAADGIEARKMLALIPYDLVILDLRMPNLNGHAVAAELLQQESRPLVVILTGVLEPALARDLIVRGVDCIEFKPVNYDLFVAKVRGLVTRRRARLAEDAKSGQGPEGRGEGMPLGSQVACGPEDAELDGDNLRRRLGHLSKIMPVSEAALDVFRMTGAGSCDVSQLAAAVARDASLSADVVRLANSSFFNPSGRKIVELEEAVVRVGHKRVGEMALATGTLAAGMSEALPWLNAPLTWKRSIAAGVAADLLLAQGDCQEASEGLFLSAIMHSLGRLALGTLYPQHYQKMIAQCGESNETLEEHEERIFPLTTGEAATCLLKAWQIPEVIYEPLQYTSEDYFSLTRLAAPLATKVELVKLALFIAQLAVGEWDPWDRIEFPPAPVLRRLSIDSIANILRETRRDADEIINFRPVRSGCQAQGSAAGSIGRVASSLSYCNLSPEPFDFLGVIVASMGIDLKACKPGEAAPSTGVLLNCIWNADAASQLHSKHGRNSGQILVVTDASHGETYAAVGRVLTIPTSYASLKAACDEILRGARAGHPSPIAPTHLLHLLQPSIHVREMDTFC